MPGPDQRPRGVSTAATVPSIAITTSIVNSWVSRPPERPAGEPRRGREEQRRDRRPRGLPAERALHHAERDDEGHQRAGGAEDP